MFNKIKILHSIVLLALLFLLVASCKKNEESNTDSDNKFIVEFTDGFVRDKVWVVLHSLDGTLDIETKMLEKGGIIDFGKIVTTQITFSIINADLSYNPPWDKKNFDIESFYNVPVGKYYFDSNKSSLLRESYDLKLSYPKGHYNEYYIGRSYGGDYWPDVPEEGTLTHTIHANPSSLFSIYASVLNDNGGYCNWKMDIDPQNIDSNKIELQLNKPLELKNITTNMPVSSISVNNYFNERQSMFNSYSRDYYPDETKNPSIYYPENFPCQELGIVLKGSIENESGFMFNTWFTYFLFLENAEDIPLSFHIPDLNIGTEYYETIDAFGVQTTEENPEIDIVSSYWQGSDDERLISWKIYSPISMSTIKRPALSSEVETALGEHYLWTASWSGIGLINYVNIVSYEKYIEERFMKKSVIDFSFESRYVYSSSKIEYGL